MKRLIIFIQLVVATIGQGQVPLTGSQGLSEDSWNPLSTPRHTPIVQVHDKWYRNWFTCSVCRGWVAEFKRQTDTIHAKKVMKGFLWLSCAFQYPQSFCKQEVDILVDASWLHMYKLIFDEWFICGYIFDLCGNTAGEYYYTQITIEAWNNQWLQNKWPETQDNNYQNVQFELSQPQLYMAGTGPTFLILKDIQLDLNYTEGASTECEDLACCHAKDVPTSDSQKASKYGSTKCYNSLDGFKRMFDAISYYNNTLIKASSIFIMGGAAHIPGLTTPEMVWEANTEIVKYIREVNPFIGIYFIMGANDAYPAGYQPFMESAKNSEYMDKFDTKLNYDAPSISEDSLIRDQFKQYGFYNISNWVYQLIMNGDQPHWTTGAVTSSNYVLIFMNTNVCINRNLELMEELDDPGKQLEWLEKTLGWAKSVGRKAWIFGDVAPGNKQCNSKWAERYKTIIELYQGIVHIQLFGHDEKNYFQLQYPAVGAQNPFAYTIQGGTASSLGQNPRFMSVEVDGLANHGLPQLVTLYEYDINKAALDPTAAPEDLIFKIKQYPQDFGMSSLSPGQFLELINRIETDEITAVNYHNKMCPNTDCYIRNCNQGCRTQMTCILKGSSQQEIIDCRGNGIQDRDYGLDYLLSQMENPWVVKHQKT